MTDILACIGRFPAKDNCGIWSEGIRVNDAANPHNKARPVAAWQSAMQEAK
jgi:hypothetical protein